MSKKTKNPSDETLTAKAAREALHQFADPERAAFLKRFFKTGPGEYAEGDVLIGIRVPDLRKVAKRFQALPLSKLKSLLSSKIHEERLLALLILVAQFQKNPDVQKQIYDLYLENTQHINNWDLVDLSAPAVMGGYLAARSRRPLYRLAQSTSLWERRIAILATHFFIRQNDFEDTIKIAEMLLEDQEDLIHKAVGWMLREVGKRDATPLEDFLKKHCRTMPRTMLRYAIERFPEKKRQRYLKGDV